MFQRLKQGLTVELEDGRVIDGRRYLGPTTPGKKLAIFGDTAPCPAALELARGVDVMVHEVTLEQAMAEKRTAAGIRPASKPPRWRTTLAFWYPLSPRILVRYDAEGCQRLLAECQEIFPSTVLAEDFMVYTVE